MPDLPAPVSGAIDHGLPDVGEGELIRSILHGDRKAAARLVAAHIDAVYGYVRVRLAPRADLVDDVVQEEFLAALNGLTAFQGHSALSGATPGTRRHCYCITAHVDIVRAHDSQAEVWSVPPVLTEG